MVNVFIHLKKFEMNLTQLCHTPLSFRNMTEGGCCLLNNAIVFAALILETHSGFPRLQNNLRLIEHETLKKKKGMHKTWCPDVSSSCNYDTRLTTLDLTSNFFKVKMKVKAEPSDLKYKWDNAFIIMVSPDHI